ncbi:hypothetical protein BDZ94DRAFT_1155481 [Collybia nuda]|uniref:Autophagy-related protein 11 n=1 Tax=Collybia nuda TaxID=64659 RepID=A0A9P5YD11_9AGAR|nr:hypothetical protein BDZ94DRAFT_1155481 [Collybia nuda]
MIQICRAEDGQVFQVNASLRDIERIGSLELFLQQETGVEQDAALAYLSDGRRLTNGNVRELAGSHDQSIYVFNKYYLDYDLDDVLRDLHVNAPLQPPIEESIAATPPFRPSQLAASYLRTAHIHHEHITNTLVSMHYQHEAIRIACGSLDLNVLAIVDTFEGIAVGSRRELEKQATLLSGLEADLDLISRVRIHVEFMSPAVRKSIEAGEKSRTLGDYVSNVKMKQVAETCARTHDDLRSRFNQAEQAVRQLTEGTDTVRSAVATKKLLDEAEACLRRSQDHLQQITNGVAALDNPTPDPDVIIQELKHRDSDLRNELQYMTDAKNAYTHHCVGALRQISMLNNNIVQIPPTLANLQASFRGKNSFSHIQRLHNMLYAYGATVVEIVRRKEFSRFFYQRAQSILEVMAKLSASERKRRQVYRGEVHGQLPFETRGMDDPVPTIDFSPSGSLDASYSLEREDVDGLLRVLDDLEQYSQSSNDTAALSAVRECRISLDKLVVRMDGLESAFDRIAERSLLSASRISVTRRRSVEAEQQAYQDLIDQLRAAQEAKTNQELAFQEERRGFQAEISKLKTEIHEVDTSVSGEQERSDRLERELHQARAQVESEVTARRVVEERNSELSADVEHQRKALSQALADATECSKVAEELRRELNQVNAEFEDVKALESRNAEKVNNLLEEQAINLRNLELSRARGEDLESQIQAARAESEEVHKALNNASQEKDRLLRAQASEHDRIIRDHIAEADGDRAVLERQFFELKAVQEHSDRQFKNLRAEVEVANADAVGLREELQRIEHELREARHVERLLRDDLKAGQASQSDFEQRLEDSGRLIAQILDVAISFRNSHVKALTSAQTMVAHPTTSKQSPGLADSMFLSGGMRHSIIGQPDEPSPIDPSDPPAALEILRAYDHDHFLEAVAKAGSTIRKWQKQCKEYRERAKGKISFRNFAKGDLALFLPTRNSVSKPWAAFNVSFPHYFLQATGHLAEQLKTREWIVARITSIAERVVDHQDPTSNPYGLGEGVKYYMLEVEDWTQPSHNKRRVSSRKVSIEKEVTQESILGSSPPALPPGPPEAEVEESFLVTHPPNSHLFPVRARANSSPTVRPSSLSRLLAQAAPETQLEPVPQTPIKEPSPTAPPLPLPPPSPQTGSVPHHLPGVPSPLRPGSRASRMSTTSRFSVNRLPALGNTVSGSPMTKAAPTIALSETPLASSPSSGEGNPFGLPSTPSPDGSISDGMANILNPRQRATSYHVPRTSPLAASSSTQSKLPRPARPTLTATGTLASLASSWGFSRKKRIELDSDSLTVTPETPTDPRRSSDDQANSDPSASELLKRF